MTSRRQQRVDTIMEDGATSSHNTKISDSAYSNSCSNSQSQRSGSSSKSRESNCSGSSSGYGGKDGHAVPQQPSSKRSKDRKKKKLKSTIQVASSTIADDTQKPEPCKEIASDEQIEKTAGIMR